MHNIVLDEKYDDLNANLQQERLNELCTIKPFTCVLKDDSKT